MGKELNLIYGTWIEIIFLWKIVQKLPPSAVIESSVYSVVAQR